MLFRSAPRRYSTRDTSVPIVASSGSTPLHFAATNGYISAMCTLLIMASPPKCSPVRMTWRPWLTYILSPRCLPPHSADHPPMYPACPSAVYVGPLCTCRICHVRPHVGLPCTSCTLVHRVRPARWSAVYVLFTIRLSTFQPRCSAIFKLCPNFEMLTYMLSISEVVSTQNII